MGEEWYLYRKLYLMFKLFISLALITISFLPGNSQKYKVVTCGFYNLENLFDTENDTMMRSFYLREPENGQRINTVKS
jgi:hypothetical protein